MKTMCMAMVLAVSVAGMAGEEVRILFVGNSYTSYVKGTLLSLAGQVKDKKVTMEFITPGGCTLAKHLTNEGTVKKIKEGKWTYVVLQDQSQVPSLGGASEASFHESVKKLAEMARESGAKPVLYMTWGRRDGDKMNATINPDYETMQKRLTAAYSKAAKENDCLLVPVGEVWAAVRKRDAELGKALYVKDGSHPSKVGGYLASSVMLNRLLGVAPEALAPGKDLTDAQTAVIRAAMKGE